jgi:hypothetical protein
MLPRGQSPFILLLIGLFVALIAESILGQVAVRLLLDQPLVVRWIVTLGVVAGAVALAVRTRWLTGAANLSLQQLVPTTIVVLLALRLLEGRVQELGDPWRLVMALAVGAAIGAALWRAPGPRAVRQWIAPLFGVVMFATLYW